MKHNLNTGENIGNASEFSDTFFRHNLQMSMKFFLVTCCYNNQSTWNTLKNTFFPLIITEKPQQSWKIIRKKNGVTERRNNEH